MIINLQKAKKAPERKAFVNTSPFDSRFGFWGIVTEVHPEDNAVNVLTDTGFEIPNVRVASLEWVVIDKEKHLTGERHLPPKNAFVFCLMPTGEYSSAFVLCSGFARQEAYHADFKGKGEDFALTHEKVNNSGWVYKSDYRNGTMTIQNDYNAPTVSVSVNQGENGEKAESKVVTIKVFDTTITATEKDDKEIKIETLGNSVLDIKEDSIDFTSDCAIHLTTKGDKTLTVEGSANIVVKGDLVSNVDGNASLEVKKDCSVKATGNANIEGQNISVKSSLKTEIKGGQVVIAGSVAPKGTGAFCALPACAFTGAPHVGDTSAGA